jgi:hypothetical protein
MVNKTLTLQVCWHLRKVTPCHPPCFNSAWRTGCLLSTCHIGHTWVSQGVQEMQWELSNVPKKKSPSTYNEGVIMSESYTKRKAPACRPWKADWPTRGRVGVVSEATTAEKQTKFRSRQISIAVFCFLVGDRQHWKHVCNSGHDCRIARAYSVSRNKSVNKAHIPRYHRFIFNLS